MDSEGLSYAKRVGIVSTTPIRLAGLCEVFEDDPGVSVVSGGIETLLADPQLQCLIFDVDNEINWLETLFVMRRDRPDIRQIVLGPPGNDEMALKSIVAGARAYVDTDACPLAVREAVAVVTSGIIWAPRRLMSKLVDRLLTQTGAVGISSIPAFSRRERQVLNLIMAACSNREIAAQLGIEERTVKAYVGSLLRKTGAENRVSLSVLATQDSRREGHLRMA